MAKMYPLAFQDRIPEPGENEAMIQAGNTGEKMVYDLLRDELDDSWICMHSVKISYDSIHEREADFIVLVPNRGILVIEVKHWKHGRIVGEKWYPSDDDKNAKPAPHEQARSCVVKLNNVLEDRNIVRAEYRSISILTEHIPSGFEHYKDKDRYWIYHELTSPGTLRKRIEQLFDCDRHCGREIFDTNALHKVWRFLYPSYSFKMPVEQYIALMERESAPLLGLLPALEDCTCGISVQGCAGSGKTYMLMEEAKRISIERSHKSILILCYNANLKDHLKTSVDNWPTPAPNTTVSVYTINGYASKLCNDTIIKLDRATQQRVFGIKLNVKHDYIFIDEAQDSDARLISNIREHWLADDGKIYLFYDTNQTLQDRKQHPAFPTQIKLRTNLRNSRQIGNFSKSIIQGIFENGQEAPQTLPLSGRVIGITQPKATTKEREKAVLDIVEKLRREGIPSENVVLLSPWSSENERCSFNRPKLAKRIRKFSTKGDKLIQAETIKSFKGLESHAVILTDIPIPQKAYESGFTPNDFYVACTRARYALYIVPESQEAFNYIKNELGGDDVCFEDGC